MPILTYDTGTISVANGSAAVTGVGSFWMAPINPGDLLLAGTGIGYIATVTDDTHLVLAKAWAAPTLSGAGYLIIRLPQDWSLAVGAITALMDALVAETILFHVDGDEPDPSLGEEGQYAIKVNTGVWKLWLKTGGVWVLQGTPVGTNWRGAWSGATTYAINDVVSRLGSSYISIQAGNLNHAPESSPTYWELSAASGSTGTTGTSIHLGSGVPGGGLGNNGDVYFRTDTSDVYSKSAGAWAIVANIKGATGATGVRGAAGGPVAIPYVVDGLSTQDSDPGVGKMRFSAVPQNIATVLRVSSQSALATAVGNLLNSISLASSSDIKIAGRLFVTADESKYLTFTATAVAMQVGYANITIAVTGSSGANPFADGDAVTLDWVPKGDKGAAGTIGIASTITGDPGTAASVTNLGTAETASLQITIPRGDVGDSFSPQYVVTLIADRDDYDVGPVLDANDRRLSVLVEEDSTHGDAPTLYFLQSIDPPVWSDGIPFAPVTEAASVSYDNSDSGLTAINAQTALDELAANQTDISDPTAMAMIFGGA